MKVVRRFAAVALLLVLPQAGCSFMNPPDMGECRTKNEEAPYRGRLYELTRRDVFSVGHPDPAEPCSFTFWGALFLPLMAYIDTVFLPISFGIEMYLLGENDSARTSPEELLWRHLHRRHVSVYP